jgi:hypothetical protein
MVLARTARQALVLEAIQRHYRRHKYAPTYSQLAQIVGVKQRNQIWRVVKGLVGCGALVRHETPDGGVILIPADMTAQNKRANPKLARSNNPLVS